MPFKERLAFFCLGCKVRFEREVLANHYPEKGCPKCGELPDGGTPVAAWWENARGRMKGHRIYSFGEPAAKPETAIGDK